MALYQDNEHKPLSIEIKYMPKPKYDDEDRNDEDNLNVQKIKNEDKEKDKNLLNEQNDIMIEDKSKSHFKNKTKENDHEYTKYDAENKILSEENMLLSSDNSMLHQKLEKLKMTVINIKKRLEKDISKQLEQKNKIQNEQANILEDLLNQISKMKQAIMKKHRLKEDITFFNNQIELVLKEQFDMETLLKNQEEDIKRLTEQANKINRVIQLKDQETDEYEQGCQQLTTILDEDQKMINSLKEMIKKKETDEKKQNDLIAAKEAEIHLFQEIINSTKRQHTFITQNEQNLLKQIKKSKEENKQLNSLIHSTTQKKINENIIDINNEQNYVVLNEIEEDNFKELNELMTKVLNE